MVDLNILLLGGPYTLAIENCNAFFVLLKSGDFPVTSTASILCISNFSELSGSEFL